MPIPLVPGTCCRLAATLFAASTMAADLYAEPLALTLRERGEYANTWREVKWDPAKTAVIVCDMWDSHHSVTAVRRVNEFAPRLNEVLKAARADGATIIHSPSDCMPAYADHAARKRALVTPAAEKSPPDMGAWCHRIPTEERAAYPIDQSDGGEDEDAWENDQWAARLEADGRNPGTPWLKQNALLEIADEDYIASEGEIVWNILKGRGIEHVVLSGVHTNMCVLGRPFGLRQMVRAGMDTVLLRDCTDVMYNPARWPYVSHFTGLDLVVGHIEQHVCPTITSDQIVGGEAFRFKHDMRPQVVVITAGDDAPHWRAYARRFLDADFRVEAVIAEKGDGAAHIADANALVLDLGSALPERLYEVVRTHIAAAKPLLGVGMPLGQLAEFFGTEEPPPPGEVRAEDFFNRVGGIKEVALEHPLVGAGGDKIWGSENYLVHKLRPTQGTQAVRLVKVDGRGDPIPGAWTFTRSDGGRSFFMAFGIRGAGVGERPEQLLRDAICWATGRAIPSGMPEDPDLRREREGWRQVDTSVVTAPYHDLRTLLRTPTQLAPAKRFVLWEACPNADVFLNGESLPTEEPGKWRIEPGALRAGDLNLLVFHLSADEAKRRKTPAGTPSILEGGSVHSLDGTHWQERYSAREDVETGFPIPPQFGAPTDLIQNWPVGG